MYVYCEIRPIEQYQAMQMNCECIARFDKYSQPLILQMQGIKRNQSNDLKHLQTS